MVFPRGRKRKSTVEKPVTPIKPMPVEKPTTLTTSVRKARKLLELLSVDQYRPKKIGTRILSCGEGEQIGHPGRNVTRKPRAVDTFPEGTQFAQVAAGGVHSLALTTTGVVYSCGINEKGTVPVVGLEPEETTDRFTEIAFSSEIGRLGKIVQVTAGASFSAALTEGGSVVAWGNLRDVQGDVTIHQTLSEMQKTPTIVFNHKKAVQRRIVKISAGENHLVMLSERGEVLTLGEGSMGQLGRSTRTDHIRSRYMVDETGTSLVVHVLERGRFVVFVDVWAKGFWTLARAQDGRLFACGLNNFGQLGVLSPVVSGAGGNSSIISSSSGGRRGRSTSSAGGQSRQSSSSATTTTVQQMEPMEEEEEMNGEAHANQVGQEEATKVGRITCARAFPADRVWTHCAGVQHIVCRNEDGELWAIGKNTDNALGLGTWTGNKDAEHWRYDSLQRVQLPAGDDGKGGRAAGLDATLGASVVWTEDGRVFSFGCDTVGQLGLGIAADEEEKIVPTPRRLQSAHLDGYRVISASIADNHALFLAAAAPLPTAIQNGGVE